VTGQIPDEANYLGTWYAITAVEGTGLFDPTEYGFDPRPMSTGCWRGYVCRYLVADDRLTLRGLEIGRTDEHERISLHGVTPTDGLFGALRYEPDAPVEFTGRLLIGDDYLRLGYLHMGFVPAWLFADVRELVFDRGRLTHAYDRSAELAAVRERLGPAGLKPPSPDPEARRAWIDATFSLSYAYSWPTVD